MRTRFAPSPTGYLHLGHVVNAIYVWGLARSLNGEVLLRIEDHDRLRCRPEYESAILDDLEWLGFEPDAAPPVRQRERGPLYEAALRDLRATHQVYACDCSRKRIAGERYDGRCRGRRLLDTPGTGLRVCMDRGVEEFDDLLLGRVSQSPADQCGDLLIRDRDGHWTYQFAVAVDDMLQEITHVIRGDDLLASTGRQLRLRRMLGRSDPPTFFHHRLIFKQNGEKLSKSARDSGVRELRAAGLTAAEIIGRAAAAVGLVKDETPIAAAEAARLFDDVRGATRV